MPDTRWLDDEEQQTWRTYLSAVQMLFDQLDEELQRDAGLPHTYYMVLAMLSEAPGRAMRMTELGELVLSSRSRLSHAVSRLEERGLVERRACPTDQRGQVAVLTDDGYTALAAAAPDHVAGVRRHLFDRLTPAQVGQLKEISRAIAGPLADHRGAAERDRRRRTPRTRFG